MAGMDLNKIEDEGIVPQRRFGLGLMTVGKLLLWVDFLLLAFVPDRDEAHTAAVASVRPGRSCGSMRSGYDGIRSGSRMWLYWVIGQGVLGLVLIEIGWRKRGGLSR